MNRYLDSDSVIEHSLDPFNYFGRGEEPFIWWDSLSEVRKTVLLMYYFNSSMEKMILSEKELAYMYSKEKSR